MTLFPVTAPNLTPQLCPIPLTTVTLAFLEQDDIPAPGQGTAALFLGCFATTV